MNQLILWNIALTKTKFYIALDKQNNLNDWIEINDNHGVYVTSIFWTLYLFDVFQLINSDT